MNNKLEAPRVKIVGVGVKKESLLGGRMLSLSYTLALMGYSEHLGGKLLELDQAYVPHKIEQNYMQNEYFVPNHQSDEVPFSMVLPPPNVTGTLHLGHALTATIQDVLVRWHKMKGRKTIWVPGLDHAGIATQVVVEKKIWIEQKKTRKDLGREAFEKEVWKWKDEKGSTITKQLQRLNVSLNWEKEVFTMDESRMKAVTEAFIRLFDQGLIYRADHLVNWSCVLQSAISDIEVDHLTVEGATDLNVPGYDQPVRFGVLTTFAYQVKDSTDEIMVATTRPETILGDVAVAVNPNDPRYSNLIGKRLIHPFRKDFIPIVADDMADPTFGTGAVKITPAHDPVDFEAGKRHKLSYLQVINEEGKLTSLCPEFEGMRRFEARSKVINRLAEMHLLRGSEDHKMVVPLCSRSKDVIEFLIRPQWFLKCGEMARKAVEDVKEKRLKIEPSNFESTWFNWLENCRDWCISRQLWWGHRIPIYFCFKKGSPDPLYVAAESLHAAKQKAVKLLNCSEDEIVCIQDEDVLDTWFSSGLQPFSSFGWPQETNQFKQYYPLSLMETGHDILFFWVARMVMLGNQLTGKLPFNKILLHGIICDSQGRKMSKSLGNVIAPEDVINGCTLENLNSTLETSYKNGILSKQELKKALVEQKKHFPQGIPECGADALRYTLLSHNVKNHVINFDVSECQTNKLFCNKIWQATKFATTWFKKVAGSQGAQFYESSDNFVATANMDKWILSRLSWMVENVSKGLENKDFYIATAAIKNFLYYEFCDVYLEAVKTTLRNDSQEVAAKTICRVMLLSLDTSLRCLAPFMPVLSQHLHEHLPLAWRIGEEKGFPQKLSFTNELVEKEVNVVLDIIVAIRRLKTIFKVTAKHQREAILVTRKQDCLSVYSQTILDLAFLNTLQFVENTPQSRFNWVKDAVGDTTIYLKVPEDLRRSLEADLPQLDSKQGKLLKDLAKMHKMMSGEGYEQKASIEAKEIHLKKVSTLKEQIARIEYIKKLSKS